MRGRFPETEPLFLDRLISLFEEVRERPNLTKKPSTSELIDWTQVLTRVHDREAIEAWLESTASSPDLTRFPALGCLIKLREDRETLGLDGA